MKNKNNVLKVPELIMPQIPPINDSYTFDEWLAGRVDCGRFDDDGTFYPPKFSMPKEEFIKVSNYLYAFYDDVLNVSGDYLLKKLKGKLGDDMFYKELIEEELVANENHTKYFYGGKKENYVFDFNMYLLTKEDYFEKFQSIKKQENENPDKGDFNDFVSMRNFMVKFIRSKQYEGACLRETIEPAECKAFYEELKSKELQNRDSIRKWVSFIMKNSSVEFTFTAIRVKYQEKLKQSLLFLEKPVINNPVGVFKLTKKFSKIDLIRILDALWELNLIENADGTGKPGKNLFMQKTGEFFNCDLSEYDSSLSKSLMELSLKINVKIFNEMKNAIEEKHHETLKKS